MRFERIRRFIVPREERRHHHIAISAKLHEAVTFYAYKRGTTITSATEFLIRKGLQRELKKDAKK